MFGQRNTHDDTAGAPAVPPAGSLNTSTGIPDDNAVNQMLSEFGGPTAAQPQMTQPMQAAAQPQDFNPFGGGVSAPQPAAPAFSGPTEPTPMHSPDPMPTSTPMSAHQSDEELHTDDLLRMKHDALQHLQPLVGNLQQNPEDEFRTFMMMIQATDDRALLKKALDAAKKIQDDKVRAQAMLDVINEINYFTQVENQE